MHYDVIAGDLPNLQLSGHGGRQQDLWAEMRQPCDFTLMSRLSHVQLLCLQVVKADVLVHPLQIVTTKVNVLIFMVVEGVLAFGVGKLPLVHVCQLLGLEVELEKVYVRVVSHPVKILVAVCVFRQLAHGMDRHVPK